MGGADGSTVYNDVWWSMNNGTTWTRQTANANWLPRSNFTSVVMPDGSIVLMGGQSGSTYNNEVWRLGNNDTTWIEINSSAGWVQRSDLSSVVIRNSSIVVMGGWDSTKTYNDTWQFQPAGSSIQNLSHTYTNTGNYTVALNAYNSGAYNNTLKANYIYAYIPPPTFTGISPISGSTSVSTTVTITGTNLIGATGVTFGGTPATSIDSVSATSITATTPSNTVAGAVDVVVTTPNGTEPGGMHIPIRWSPISLPLLPPPAPHRLPFRSSLTHLLWAHRPAGHGFSATRIGRRMYGRQ